MAEHSKISWLTRKAEDGTVVVGGTLNPWIGCAKVSAGCANCYAIREDKRYGWTSDGWGKGKPRKRTSQKTWANVRLWDNQALRNGYRKLLFVASLADVFDDEVPDAWRTDLWAVLDSLVATDVLLLTKRPENILRMFPLKWLNEGIPLHIWTGTSAEDDGNYFTRWSEITKVQTVAGQDGNIFWLSAEPLLGRIDIAGYRETHQINYLPDWVVVGGESGPGARPMHPGWVSDILNDCEINEIPFFFKQHGEWATKEDLDRNFIIPGPMCKRVLLTPTGKTTDVPLVDIYGGSAVEMYQVGRNVAGDRFLGEEFKNHPR